MDKEKIIDALSLFRIKDTYSAALNFWNTLGYFSDRQPELNSFSFDDFAAFSGDKIDPTKARKDDWDKFYLLFQITDEEMKNHFNQDSQITIPGINKQNFQAANLKSYLFASLKLKGDKYTRTQLANIARQINKQYAIPLIILFHYNNFVTIAVVNRRQNLKDTVRDVLEKVTMIKDIKTTDTHRAHIDILADLSLEKLSEKGNIYNFETLHNAWSATLDINELNKRFYKELSNWYFWAIKKVVFPAGDEENEEVRNSIGLIRLLTRLIFVWFMKEKGLIPEELFDSQKLRNIIKFEDFNDSAYYKAILQNLFFATLNTEMNKDKVNSRRFRREIISNMNPDFNVHTLFRYESLFHHPEQVIDEYFANIPFLNGGLFECLDTEITNNNQKSYIRIDGFSDRPDNILKVPDELFLSGNEQNIDLNEIYGTQNKSYQVRGLFSILNSYKFTVAENTPIEEEVALDPELLGRVFENLLASYNPETKTTARHETGSFYTPREIVDYMVDESLIAYLINELPHSTKEEKEDSELKLRLLLYYTDEDHLFDPEEVNKLINAIDNLKVIDPACGSGAFLMGLLLKIVYILHKLDPHNTKWKQQQIDNIKKIITNIRQTVDDPKVMENNIQKLKDSIQDIEQTFDEFDFDYSRKLFLIEHCIYGIDIQPIAIQIAKLRLFISLLVDQYPKKGKPNLGIRALPNLETNLVAANSLIPLKMENQMDIFNTIIDNYISEIKALHKEYFSTRNRKDKLELKAKEHKLRMEFSEELKKLAFPVQEAEDIANWDPYSVNSIAPFFNPTIMFGLTNFNIVIANPPFVRQEKITYKDLLAKSGYQIFNSTSDLYTYFYELAYKLLSENGIATFITSNKWLRSKYGTKLRQFLKQNTKLQIVIDFGGYQVFKSSTVDTNIILFIKDKPEPQHLFNFVNIPADLKPENLSQFLYNNMQTLQQKTLEVNCWTLADNSILNLKTKIEKAGKPLKDWDVNIYRGVLTGCDEAFIIDNPTKEAICKADPKSIEIIKPVLRGRDIHKYYYEWAGLWLIIIPSGWTNKNKPDNIDAEQFIKLCYPAVYNYLKTKGDAIENNIVKVKGKGLYYRDDQGDYWWELRKCSYYNEFNKPKIIYPNMTKYLPFVYDKKHFYPNPKCYILTGEETLLYTLTSLFNSKLISYYIKVTFPELQGGTRELHKNKFEYIPIPDSLLLNKDIVRLSFELDNRIKSHQSCFENEDWYISMTSMIDTLVYKLYGLNEADIKLITNTSEK
ncbi:MAG: TaqI-like C-terminal specificity domain-containing protein [Candidatus Cloacimonas sp.]|nr:Eco57I restriction-modification methylase domain-containing protein [Candidatus Cloacimonas sp.]